MEVCLYDMLTFVFLKYVNKELDIATQTLVLNRAMLRERRRRSGTKTDKKKIKGEFSSPLFVYVDKIKFIWKIYFGILNFLSGYLFVSFQVLSEAYNF